MSSRETALWIWVKILFASQETDLGFKIKVTHKTYRNILQFLFYTRSNCLHAYGLDRSENVCLHLMQTGQNFCEKLWFSPKQLFCAFISWFKSKYSKIWTRLQDLKQSSLIKLANNLPISLFRQLQEFLRKVFDLKTWVKEKTQVAI